MAHVMRLLTLQFLNCLHAALRSTSLHAVEDDKLTERNALQQLQLTAPAISLFFALPPAEVVDPLHIKLVAVVHPEMMKLDSTEKAVCSLATSADAGLSQEGHRPLLYRGEASRHRYVHLSSKRTSKYSSVVMMTAHQRKVFTRNSFQEEGVEVGAGGVKKKNNVIETTPAVSGALETGAGPVFQVLKVVTKEYCDVKDTFFNEVEDKHILEKGSAPHQNVELVLADPRVQHSQCAGAGRLRSHCLSQRGN